MTPRALILATALVLGAVLAPGCTPVREDTRVDGRQGELFRQQFGATNNFSPYSQQPTENPPPDFTGPPPNTAQGHQAEPVRDPGVTVIAHAAQGQAPALEAAPTARQTADQEPAAPDEPLVAALRCFLHKHPTEAVEILKRYDTANQQMLLCLLPLAVRLTEGSIEQAGPQEADALANQLQGLALPLHARAPLHIDKMCFCRKIKRYGDYEPLPEDQAVFQGGSEGRGGELVQVYAEIRNFTSALHEPIFVTRLASSMEICPYGSKTPVWTYNFPNEEPDTSRSPRQDYFINYRFTVPANLAPGHYTLWVQVQDVLGQPPRPPARKSLDFSVIANGTARRRAGSWESGSGASDTPTSQLLAPGSQRGEPKMASKPGGGGS